MYSFAKSTNGANGNSKINSSHSESDFTNVISLRATLHHILLSASHYVSTISRLKH